MGGQFFVDRRACRIESALQREYFKKSILDGHRGVQEGSYVAHPSMTSSASTSGATRGKTSASATSSRGGASFDRGGIRRGLLGGLGHFIRCTTLNACTGHSACPTLSIITYL